MDLSINVESNISASSSDDKERQFLKPKSVTFKTPGVVFETLTPPPINPTGRGSHPQKKEDCMQPKIRLERLCLSSSRSNTLRGCVHIRDILNCCTATTTMENGHSGTTEKEIKPVSIWVEHQNHVAMDDKERAPCELKRVRTPSSTPNKKKPYRAAKRDENGTPSTIATVVSIKQEQPVYYNGVDTVIQTLKRDFLDDKTSWSSSDHISVTQDGDLILRAIKEPGYSSIPRLERVKIEPTPRESDYSVVNRASESQEESQLVAKSLIVSVKGIGDLGRTLGGEEMLEEKFPILEKNCITESVKQPFNLGVGALSSVGERQPAENRVKRIITDIPTLHVYFEKTIDSEYQKDIESKKVRKTPSFWRGAMTDETVTTALGEKQKTLVTRPRRKETLCRFYRTKKAVNRPRLARAFPTQRLTSFYFRRKVSLARLQLTRSKTGVSRRSHRSGAWRQSRTVGKLNARKEFSKVSARLSSENQKDPVADTKVTSLLKNSGNKVHRSVDQSPCANHLPGVHANGSPENPEKRKPGVAEEVFENPWTSGSYATGTNRAEVPKLEHVNRSMFDNFAESEFSSVRYRVDDGEDRDVFQKAETTTTLAEIHAAENRRGNIFEKFRSSMQREDAVGDCLLNLSKKKDRNGTEKSPVTTDMMISEKEDVIPFDRNHKEIKELLGDFDSDSTECCKYDELDEVYPDNRTTKDAQLGGFLTERAAENFYPGFSVFNMLSDSDDNLVVDESTDSQLLETQTDQKSVQDTHANSDDEDRQLKKLRSTAYRTYTRKRKQLMLQKGGGADDIIAADTASRRTISCSSPSLAETKVPQCESEDARQRSKSLEPKAQQQQPEGKRKDRSPKKTNMKTVNRRKTGIGKSPKTVPASRHSLLKERKKVTAKKKSGNVCKEFATRSRTRNKYAEESSGSQKRKTPSTSLEVSETTAGNNETADNNVEAVRKGKFSNKKIRNGGCRRGQRRQPAKNSATDTESRPGRRKIAAPKPKEDSVAKDTPPRMDILSRELGPRYNWLEQKIQAMQRSCSDEGLDARGPRPSPPETQNNPSVTPKRSSNIKYESDDECRGPRAKRRSVEDRRSKGDDHSVSDRSTIKGELVNGHVKTASLQIDTGMCLTKSSGTVEDFYDPPLSSLPSLRLSRGPRVSPSLVWTVAAPNVATTTSMPLGLKLVRSTLSNALPPPPPNPPLPSDFTTTAPPPSSLNILNDEEGLVAITEPRRSHSLSPAPSPTVCYYDRRLVQSLGGSASMVEPCFESEGSPNGMRSFATTSRNRVVGSLYVQDYSIVGSAAPGSDPRSFIVPEESDNVFPVPHELDSSSSDCQVPFDLSRPTVRSQSPADMGQLNVETLGLTACSSLSPLEDQVTPLRLTIRAHKEPPSETESTANDLRKTSLDQDMSVQGPSSATATQESGVGSKIGEGETVIDLTTDVDSVPDEGSRPPKPHPSQESSEGNAQQDTRSTPVLRSIKYEYVRRLEMYERLSKVSKIKDQEIAILESERKRVKKELDCLKNIFARASAGQRQESDDRTEKANAIGTENAADSPVVVEPTWSPAGEPNEARKAKEAHRRESTVRLVASRTPPDAHSVKMDLSMYTYLKCQYKQDRLRAEEEFKEAYISDYDSRTGPRETDSDGKVLVSHPTPGAPSSSVRSASSTSSGHALPYLPERVAGPFNQGNQAWISVQSGEYLNGTDARLSALAASGSITSETTSQAESALAFGSARTRSIHKSDVNEDSLVSSQLRIDFRSSQANQQQDLSRRRAQTLAEPAPRQHSQDRCVRPLQELEPASQPPRPSSDTVIERKPILRQIVTENLTDMIRPSPPAVVNSSYGSHEQQTNLVPFDPDCDRRLVRFQETTVSDEPTVLVSATSRRRVDSQERQIESAIFQDDNQYEVMDLSRTSISSRPSIGSQSLERSQIENAAEGDVQNDETPLALDLKSEKKDVRVSRSISMSLRSSGPAEPIEVLDDLPNCIDGDDQVQEYSSQPRRYRVPTRNDENASLGRDRSLAKNQWIGEIEITVQKNPNTSLSSKVYALPEEVDRGNTEPVDLKIIAVQGPTVERDQSKVERVGGVAPMRSRAHRQHPAQASSELVIEVSVTDTRVHSIKNLISDIAQKQQSQQHQHQQQLLLLQQQQQQQQQQPQPPQQQQQKQLRSRDKVNSFDSPKIIVPDSEKTVVQVEEEKPEASASSPKTNGRKPSRRWPKQQQKSPQQSFNPEKYGLSSNLQDMSFMVNSISSAGTYSSSSGASCVDQTRSINDLQAPSAETEQRPTAQTDALNTLSPTYNAKVLVPRPGYDHGEKRGAPLAPYPIEQQQAMILQQRPAETGPAFSQARDAVELESIRQHARETSVYRAEESSSSSTSGAQPSIQRYGELQQGGVALRGGRDDVAHVQVRHPPAPPPPPSFRPSNSPVIGHRDSAFVALASQRKDNAQRQTIEQIPQSDSGRHGNSDLYKLRQQPGIGAYPQSALIPAPRQGEAQMQQLQQRFYVSGSMPLPPDAQPTQPVNHNDRIPLSVYQKSSSQPFAQQQVRQDNVPRGAHSQLATHRLIPHQMDLVPSSDPARNATYGAMILNPRTGLELQRVETGVMPVRPEDALLFTGQARSDAMTISRIVMQQQAQRSQASAVAFQDAASVSLRSSGPDPSGFGPHPVPGIDASRIAGWRVSQEYAVRAAQESQQMQEASRNASTRLAVEQQQRAMGLVDQRTLGVAPVPDQLTSSRDALQLRMQHPVQLIGDRYLPSYMESIAGAPQQIAPYRIPVMMQAPVPSSHLSRQPGKEDNINRLPAPQRHSDQAQPPSAINMRAEGLRLFQPTQSIFSVPPGMVNPSFSVAGHSNPTHIERLHLRPGYDLQKAQESFSSAVYGPYDRSSQLLGGRTGLAVQPANMTSGRQQRQDETHPVKTSQVPIHQGSDGYKQPPAQAQPQPQRGQVAKTINYICEVCRKPAMFVCSACKGVAYCSTECQAISWQTKHSSMCRQP